MEEAAPEIIMKIMGKCIITRAEYLHHTDTVEYYAISPLFPILAEGVMPSFYTFTVEKEILKVIQTVSLEH